MPALPRPLPGAARGAARRAAVCAAACAACLTSAARPAAAQGGGRLPTQDPAAIPVPGPVPAPPDSARGDQPWAGRLERAGFGWAARALRDTVREGAGDTIRVGGRAPATCNGQIISDIVVVTQPPYAGGLLGRFGFVERTVRALHATTKPEVVRRFLVL